MSLILLADDSPHAQRMGQSILAGEGFAVECVANGEDAALRFLDADPDVVIVDAHLPGVNGIDLCRDVKSRRRHVRVILTVGSLEELDELAAHRAGCDAILRKPFEASEIIAAVRPLALQAQEARKTVDGAIGVSDPADDVRAAVERAVERELPRFLDEVTQKVLAALGH
jgi:DNA-binding response OmpR family regulator